MCPLISENLKHFKSIIQVVNHNMEKPDVDTNVFHNKVGISWRFK